MLHLWNATKSSGEGFKQVAALPAPSLLPRRVRFVSGELATSWYLHADVQLSFDCGAS